MWFIGTHIIGEKLLCMTYNTLVFKLTGTLVIMDVQVPKQNRVLSEI